MGAPPPNGRPAPEVDGDSFDLRALFGTIRRSLWLIVLITAVCAAAGYGFSRLQTKQYTSSASVLLSVPSAVPGVSLSDPSATPDSVTATNFELASQDVVARQTAQRLLQTGHPAAADAVGNVKVSIAGTSLVLKAQAQAKTPADAALVANTFAAEYIDFLRTTARNDVLNAQRLVQQQENRLTTQLNGLSPGAPTGQLRAQIASLRSRVLDLGTTASLQTGNASIIEAAVPSDVPSSPKPRQDILIGAFAGFLLGLILALTRAQLDRRLNTAEEIEQLFDQSILARIPQSDILGRNHRMPRDLPLLEAESFRMLRANLRYSMHDDIKTLLVTSAVIEDGKTTVSFYLAALAAASRGQRVLLIEADVRRPTLARKLGLPRNFGLSTLISDGLRAPLSHYCHQVPIAQHENGTAETLTMDVLLAGKTPANAAEMLESEYMRQVIQTAEREYDFIVIDTPPAAIVSDAIPLMGQVQAVLVVARMGRVTTVEAKRLRDQLEKVGAPTCGLVVNFATMNEGGYYAYGYDGRGRARLPA